MSKTKATTPVLYQADSLSHESKLSDLPSQKLTLETLITSVKSKNKISFQDLINIAELNNSDLAGSRELINAYKGKLRQSKAYPNPKIELQAADLRLGNSSFNKSTKKVSISQAIILNNRRKISISSSKAALSLKQLAHEGKKRETYSALFESYSKLIYANEASKLYDKLLRLAQKTEAVAKMRFEAKAILESEFIKAKIEVQELLLDKRRLEYQASSNADQLLSLLKVNDLPIKNIKGTLPNSFPTFNLNQLKSKISHNHPKVLSAKKSREVYKHKLRLAKRAKISDLMLNISYERNEHENEDFMEAGIGFTLPLFNQSTGRIHETKSLHRKSLHDIEALIENLNTELSSAFAFYMTAKSEAEIYMDKIVPAAKKSYTLAQAAYKNGRMDLIALLDAQRTYTKSELSLLKSKRNANIGKSNIWKITGITKELKND